MSADLLFESVLEMDLAEADSPDLSSELLEGELKSLEAESDENLRAAGMLLAFDMSTLEETAARYESDGGYSRITANRLALAGEIRRLMPDASDRVCRWFSRNSKILVEIGEKHSLCRAELLDELLSYVRRNHGERSEVAADMDALLERLA